VAMTRSKVNLIVCFGSNRRLHMRIAFQACRLHCNQFAWAFFSRESADCDLLFPVAVRNPIVFRTVQMQVKETNDTSPLMLPVSFYAIRTR
jgi:hypothetical protein